MNTIHFIAGLPRSGGALLSNLLAQNPRIHAGGGSGFLDVMVGVKNAWPLDQEALLRVSKASLEAYFSNVDKPVIVEQSYNLLPNLTMFETILGRKAKVLVPVRDMDEIVASFELLWRKASAIRPVEQERQFPTEFQSLESRAAIWLRPDQPLGMAYHRLRDAILRGYSDRLLFIDYDLLCEMPQKVMDAVYSFLGEETFTHNVSSVAPVVKDSLMVRTFGEVTPATDPMIKSRPKKAASVLGSFAARLKGMEFWKQSQKPTESSDAGLAQKESPQAAA